MTLIIFIFILIAHMVICVKPNLHIYEDIEFAYNVKFILQKVECLNNTKSIIILVRNRYKPLDSWANEFKEYIRYKSYWQEENVMPSQSNNGQEYEQWTTRLDTLYNICKKYQYNN